MNYTENYHLPQWDEDDRIMRVDFNQMCSSIEDGLLQGRDEVKTERGGINREILRLAYNHYQLVKNIDPAPDQAGVFRQDVSQQAIPGTVARDGARYMALETGTLGVRDFFSSFQVVSELNMVRNDPSSVTQGVYNFSSPMAGVLGTIYIGINLTNVGITSDFPFQVTMKNLDTNQVVWETSFEMPVNGEAVIRNYSLRMNVPFHAGVNYQITLETSKTDATGTAALLLDAEGTQAALYGGCSGCTVAHTFADEAGSEDGLAFVRYKAYGPGGTVTLQWNGRTAEPVKVLEAGTEDGCVMRELIFRLPERPMAGNELSLSFQCARTGEIWFYEWGAILC